MTISSDKYDATFPPIENGAEIKRVLTYRSGAGTPTVTATVPAFVGEEYLDTAAANFWRAVTLSSPPVVGDWKVVTS